MSRFFTRISVAWQILRNRRKHWVWVSLDKDDFTKLITERNYQPEMWHHGCEKVYAMQILKDVGNGIDDTELAIDKAVLQAEMIDKLGLREDFFD